MKKLAALLAVMVFTTGAAFSAEPLLLDPISPEILNDVPASVKENIEGLNVAVPGQEGIQATYDPNMIPQNAAAKGQPIQQKRRPRIRIVTKQGRQTNAQWNHGGKGTKAFF